MNKHEEKPVLRTTKQFYEFNGRNGSTNMRIYEVIRLTQEHPEGGKSYIVQEKDY